MPPVQRDDPYPGYSFEVTVLGVADDPQARVAAFSEVANLGATVATIKYRFGSDPKHMRMIGGLTEYENIQLKRGVTGHIEFWNWVIEGVNGNVRRSDGSIILLDEARNEVMRWNFTRAWPTKYTGPGLNAANNEIAIETLELAHEGLTVDGQAGT
jgi:phage tail-like protein